MKIHKGHPGRISNKNRPGKKGTMDPEKGGC